MRHRLVLVVVSAVLASLAPSGVAAAAPDVGTVAAPQAPAKADRPPNVLLLVSDDQATSMFNRKLMPKVFRRLVDKGTLFDRHYVASSLCCPSRTEMLTGLTEEHSGVDVNKRKLRHPTIVEALHGRGYRTAIAGKFLNSWPCSKPRRAFDLWMCQGGERSSYSSVDPTLNVNGDWKKYRGVAPQILAERLAKFIKKTPEDQPFLALYTPTTPHRPADDPRYESMPVEPHRPASYDEDTSANDKPAYTHTPPFSPDLAARLDKTHRKMARSVRGLDDSVDTILDALDGRAKNTIVVYLSDNGFLFGEHRSLAKVHAYEESVRSPMVVRAPMLTDGGGVSQALVQNVDIAKTVADLVDFPWRSDGASLVPLIDGSADKVRDTALIQHCMGPSHPCGYPTLKYEDGFYSVPSWEGVVKRRWKYVEYVTGERELYDLKNDPNELRNRAGDPEVADKQRELAAELDTLTRTRKPNTTVVTGPSGGQSVRSFRLTYLGRSGEREFRCRLTRNGDAKKWKGCDPSGWDVGPLKDGKYRAEVSAVGADGAVDESPAQRTFSIKTRGPAVKIKSRPPTETSSRKVRFRLSSPVNNAGFECRLVGPGNGGAWRDCKKKVTYKGLDHGEHRFHARAVNRAGERTSPPVEDKFSVDRSGPVADFRKRPDDETSSSDAFFRFRFDEPTAGQVTCLLDERPASRCDRGEFTATGLLPGPHQLSVRATDEYGNKGRTRFTWVVDQAPPRVTITAPAGLVTTTPSAAFSATEPVRRFECSVDNGMIFRCDPNLMTLYGVPNGAHSLRVWAVDMAGNVSAPAMTTWLQAGSGTSASTQPRRTVTVLASSPPATTLTSRPMRVTSSETAAFRFVAHPPAARFSCRLTGAGFAPCTSPLWYDDLPPGRHTFAVRATDGRGRAGPITEVSWTVRP